MTFDWNLILSHLYHLAIAYVLAIPIAWDREVSGQSAGLRTFPLVSIGACAFMLTGIHVVPDTNAYARVMYGIITGIGFIGGGAILKSEGSVTGTATAASIWNTGAMGVAVAFDRFEIALLLSILNFITLRLVRHLKPKIQKHSPSEPEKRTSG